jgi:hypothetical protein
MKVVTDCCISNIYLLFYFIHLYILFRGSFLQFGRLFQEFLQFSRTISRLHTVIATNMLLIDENIGHGALSRQFQQGRLNVGPIVHGVQFIDLGAFGFHLVEEQVLGGAAIRTVGFTEDDHLVAVNFFRHEIRWTRVQRRCCRG